MRVSPELREEIYELACSYARAADSLDGHLYASVFTEDGRLVTTGREIAGSAALYKVVEHLERYAITQHVLGQTSYRVDGEQVSGEVLCTAHHVTLHEAAANDLVMYIRYADQYRSVDGTWRIAERRVHLDWTETRPVDRTSVVGRVAASADA